MRKVKKFAEKTNYSEIYDDYCFRYQLYIFNFRRSDNPFENVEEGFTCPSTVKYARPQLARAASGVWKYIINTGEHTQTIRLEKCSYVWQCVKGLKEKCVNYLDID